MSQAARQHRSDPRPLVAEPDSQWSGDTHGAVGAMHRAIEERLLAGNELVVLPGTPRPAEAMIQQLSRLIGWGTLGACFVTVALLLA